MGLFSKLNAKVLAGIDRRAGTLPLDKVSVDGAGMSFFVGGNTRRLTLPWSDLQRAAASTRDVLVGQELILLLQSRSGQVYEVPASCPGWAELCAGLDRVEGSIASSRWQLQALTVTPGHAVEVLARRA